MFSFPSSGGSIWLLSQDAKSSFSMICVIADRAGFVDLKIHLSPVHPKINDHMKTIIIYYSFTRNNQQLAQEMQQRLNCDLYQIEEAGRRFGISILLDLVFKRKPRIKSCPLALRLYDQCIFVGPVWAGEVATPLKTFLEKEKAGINRYSFISVCGGAAGQKEKLANSLTTLVGKAPWVIEELWVSDLLSEEKKNSAQFTSAYRISERDLEGFAPKIDAFLKSAMEPERSMVDAP